MSRRKKIVVIALIIVVIAVIICGVIMKYFNGKNNKADIVLSTFAGTSYDWKCKMVDNKIATVDNIYKKDMDPDVDGGEIQIRYLIKGLKKGKTKFICNYKESGSDYSVETNIYQVSVDGDLNVKITNSN